MKPKSRPRGDYRPIYEVLFDGKDYRALPAECRLVLLTLKCTLGACGIRSVPGLIGSLEERTGLKSAKIRKALADLTETKWIEVEGSIVWMIRSFEFEPSLLVTNENHRIFARNVIASLPSCSVVERFREHYAAWFGEKVEESKSEETPPKADTPTDTPSEPIGIAPTITIPSPLPSQPNSKAVAEAAELGKQRAAATTFSKNFPNEDHCRAYFVYLGTDGIFEDVDPALRSVHKPPKDVRKYSWEIIGAALVEMQLVKAKFTASVIRAFCKKLVENQSPTSVSAQGGGSRVTDKSLWKSEQCEHCEATLEERGGKKRLQVIHKPDCAGGRLATAA